MSHTAEDLLIVYDTEAEQWASYLRSVFSGHVRQGGIRCYDIATVSGRRRRDQQDFLGLARYRVKLLVLSRGMLEGLCALRRFFLARVLTPAPRVVVLLCGVESLAPLLELVPLAGGEVLTVYSEQDANDYLSAVTDIVKKGNASSLPSRPAGTHAKLQERQSFAGGGTANRSMVVIPDRIRCGVSAEVFILLKDTEASADAEVQFSHDSQSVRVKPTHWNERTLCVKAPDLPSGDVSVTLFCGGAEVRRAHLQYYSLMTEVARLLTTAADPVVFMCQALQVSCVEKLDQRLASILLERMPSGGFQGLQSESDATPERELHLEDVPSLLHFAAQRGLQNVSSLLLQCPGAKRALCTADRHGQTPVEIAQSHGHTELHTLLKETLNMSYSGEEDQGDASVYELMGTAGGNPLPTSSSPDVQREEEEEEGRASDAEEEEEEEEEDLYAPLGVNGEEEEEEYDTILTSNGATLIANRPPAPRPRPEATTVTAAARTPFIAQVFQKKLSHNEAETLYSLPSKQAAPPRQRGHSISSSTTYDSMVAPLSPGLEELMEIQQRVKRGSLKHFSDWQTDATQQEKLRQLRASVTNNREDDGVYDVMGNDCRRGTHPVESGFYSKPSLKLKGQSIPLPTH